MTGSTLRILNPYDGIFAYYDGRIPGKRFHSPSSNWLDDGAYSLGIASYAIVSGREALVYDTHITLGHARQVRDHLESLGVQNIRVVLSHFHNDHIAGNGVFADCEIIALRRTAELLEWNRDKIASRPPVIDPVIMPNRLFDTRLDLTVGERRVELHHFNIHSEDGNVLWLPEEQLLLAGDVLEDTVTYIAEPANLAEHVAELRRLDTWPIERILPCHGDPEILAGGGYSRTLIGANLDYLERLGALNADELERAGDLREFAADAVADGSVIYFEPYEAVHRSNVQALLDIARARLNG